MPIFVEIVRHCGLIPVLRMAATCRQFRRIVNDPTVWQLGIENLRLLAPRLIPIYKLNYLRTAGYNARVNVQNANTKRHLYAVLIKVKGYVPATWVLLGGEAGKPQFDWQSRLIDAEVALGWRRAWSKKTKACHASVESNVERLCARLNAL